LKRKFATFFSSDIFIILDLTLRDKINLTLLNIKVILKFI